MWSSWNQALQARCLVSASAVALMMTSLNETFPRSPSCRLSASRASAARSMSTSLVRKKWGMGPSDVARRLAMVLRICVRGTSSYGAPPRSAGEMGEGRGACGGTAGGAAAPRTSPFSLLPASSRSRFTTRPPGPDPVTSFRSTPVSVAMRFARGDAFTRVASAATTAAAGAGDLVGARLGETLELLVVRHRHIGLRHPQHRRVELVEALALDHVHNLSADAALRPPFLDYHGAVRLRDRRRDGVHVERPERT